MRDFEEKNHYELLGLDQSASEDEIKIAFKEIALVYHPDSNFFSEFVPDSNLSEHDIGMFKAITVAYQTLSNKEKRKEYDAKLNRENLEKGMQASDQWIRPDGRSAPSASIKRPRERPPTLSNLQNLQKKYEERSASKLSTVDNLTIKENEMHSQNNSLFFLILGVLLILLILAIAFFLSKFLSVS